MRSKEIYLVLILISVVASFFLYMYVFNIYEVNVTVAPKELFADGNSMMKIKTVPLNSFGKQAPFRTSSAKFEVTGGKNLVTIIKSDEANGVMILKAKFSTGKVEVMVRPEKSLLPTLLEIPVHPNYALSNNF